MAYRCTKQKTLTKFSWDPEKNASKDLQSIQNSIGIGYMCYRGNYLLGLQATERRERFTGVTRGVARDFKSFGWYLRYRHGSIDHMMKSTNSSTKLILDTAASADTYVTIGDQRHSTVHTVIILLLSQLGANKNRIPVTLMKDLQRIQNSVGGGSMCYRGNSFLGLQATERRETIY